jgi:hypothetical protein
MEGDWLLIRVAAFVAVIILPVISAFSVKTCRTKNGIIRYVLCLIAYAITVAIVVCGYWFEGLVSSAIEERNFHSGWHWIEAVLRQYEYFAGFDVIVLIASIIACAVLFARDYRSRVVIGFRASFVTFMGFDILQGMQAGFGVAEYIKAGVFNFVGALAFGAVCAACLNRVIPFRGREAKPVLASGGATVPL